MKETLLYFDTEFTQLVKNTDLISIGIISNDNKTFYAEFTDYNRNKIDKWLTDNVIANLKFNNKSNLYYVEGNNVFAKGPKEKVRQYLLPWLKQFGRVQFVSDVCHYDFVLLLDLLVDKTIELPKYISPYCHDINADIANYYKITDREAFNKSREKIVASEIANNENKHNALYDAIVIKEIHRKIRKLNKDDDTTSEVVYKDK